MPVNQKTVIYSWVHVVASTLKGYGIEPKSFLADWDIEYDVSIPHESRIPTIKVFRAISHAMNICEDDTFGIKLAKNILPTMFHGLITAVVASENALSAVRLVVDNFHVICESVRPTLFKKDNQLILCLGSTDEIIPPIATFDAFFAAAVHISENYMGQPVKIVEASFTRQKPDDDSQFRELFGDDISYESAVNYVVLNAKDLSKPLVTHDPQTKEAMLQLINSYQAAKNQKTFSEMVAFSLKSNLFNGNTDIKYIANALNISARTLQGRLKEEGNNFREISEQVQHEVSNTLMTTSNITIDQLANRLGYTSTSNFCRAYKKWSGITPGAYRSAPYGLT